MQTEGANDRAQLAELGRELNRRIVTRWMRDGVTVMDPATTWIDADVALAPDVTILPGTQLLGRHRGGRGRRHRPGHHAEGLRDRRRRPGRAHPRRARGDRRTGRPSGRSPTCGPGTLLGARARSARSSRSRTAPSATAPRCRTCPTSATPRSARAPTSAPARSSPTTTAPPSTAPPSAKGAKTGSNNTFVAPVSIGDGAMTGGGTVVRKDVPPGALAVSAATQRNLEGSRRKPARRVREA